ncbi:hypothetical protein LTS08_005942 [Lithohypha guttulata]|uniref:Pentatricopeptide repeat protein n=1 Tax=Lithohypha guttulata TaxID=1690604 RepID=A0AAN7Y4J1_9EURO|nr:hypothetical protein LTR51_002456 [Lithohypha guttulata]KAK5082642.1 hypothetical protein LTR05_006522 [Lithohypha guttulata]KAK5099360.1 hypothetical protein LTS08_005942 [Lithohypha guttulata]
MPRHCKLSQSGVLRDSFSITSAPLLDFLLPTHQSLEPSRFSSQRRALHTENSNRSVEHLFYSALSQATLCQRHKKSYVPPCTIYREQKRGASFARLRANSLNHQRYDSKGRLIIETTPPRQPAYSLDEHRLHHFFDNNERHFAASSRLPPSFFNDVSYIRDLAVPKQLSAERRRQTRTAETNDGTRSAVQQGPANVDKQLKLLKSVRDLEDKLAKAKQELAQSADRPAVATSGPTKRTVLTKKDYLNLVDLYFYSHNSRFSPEAPDKSPTPVILDDYSFTLSADFTRPNNEDEDEIQEEEDEEDYTSPFEEIQRRLKNNQLQEIAAMQVFVDLLIDDTSSNRALHEAYQQLPQPGVAYLPKGVIRLFLQRMSTPWVKTEASKLRYLSLIDEMQQANLPITVAEWSSAIYLAGRSFGRIDQGEVNRAFEAWHRMENEAGIRSGNVTFNILFDIAVRRGKFALGETILTEMHKRNLRLNRLGRVSLMYYHGLRGDGDGVRKAYHDFVEAGEIVDTLVLNCVIASLINAREPTAAEQIYQRMKDMQSTLYRGWSEDGEETLFRRHPEPGSDKLGTEMASNQLGRILSRSDRLKKVLPGKHQELQDTMPLTPDFTTFRIMLAYHASVSGDLDRMTVLLKEMLDNFDIPLFPVVFQLLFKGFAIHHPAQGPSSRWTRQRLDMTWTACRNAIKESNKIYHGASLAALESEQSLPSVTDVKIGMSTVNEAAKSGQTKQRTLSMWEELVIDLAAFPRERLKRLERYHNSQFDESVSNETFESPFFQNAHYSAPQPELDDEEGEYSLPDPVGSTLASPKHQNFDPYTRGDPETEINTALHEGHHDEDWDRPPSAPEEGLTHASFSSFASTPGADGPRAHHRVRASKPMVCWLLRAYARVTRSRAVLEEIYGSIRKIWVPKDERESEIVLKVLLRCLKDCDRTSGRA